MTRVFNFGAGPGALPETVLQQVREELLDWRATGASVMEISHRSGEFQTLAREAEQDLRRLMAIPDDYSVLFVQGGATLQFSLVALNILGGKQSIDFVNTGHWSTKAMTHAARYAKINIAASAADNGFTRIPSRRDWRLDAGAAYVHYTPNETIGGVEFDWIPEVGDVPLVADMSSTILSRPVDVSRFGVIYAGAQKNIGPAGMTVVIVRQDLLGRAVEWVPDLLNYAKQAEAGSMLNTAPTFPWYVAALVFKWIAAEGGLPAMAATNERKSRKLYAVIDESGGFYYNPVDAACRSWMNIPFRLADAGREPAFLQDAAAAGLTALKGHAAVGGLRASLYNAMPEAGVDALIQFMQYFQQKNG